MLFRIFAFMFGAGQHECGQCQVSPVHTDKHQDLRNQGGEHAGVIS